LLYSLQLLTIGSKGKIMPQAQDADTVRVHYIGKFEDDRIFDSRRDAA